MNVAQALKVVGILGAVIVVVLCLVGLFTFINIGSSSPAQKASDMPKQVESKPYTITATKLICTDIALPADKRPVNTCDGNITVQGEGSSRNVIIAKQTKLLHKGTPQDLTILKTLEQKKTPILYTVTPGNMALEIQY